MTLYHAIILGIVQGITEFLPISSSGHLIIFPSVLNWPLQPLSFDIALHIGTLLALLIFFWRKLVSLSRNPNLILLLVIGTIPALVAGLILADSAENAFRSPILVAINMLWFGVVMGVVDTKFQISNQKFQNAQSGHPEQNGVKSKDLDPSTSVGMTYESLRVHNVLIIGLMQCLALIPGTSRSGTTIVGGRLQHLSREQSAEFAFLLGIPVTLAAVLKGSLDLYSAGINQSEISIMLAGIITSALVGIIAIKWLLKFLTNHGLLPFVIYRLVIGTGLLILFLGK